MFSSISNMRVKVTIVNFILYNFSASNLIKYSLFYHDYNAKGLIFPQI